MGKHKNYKTEYPAFFAELKTRIRVNDNIEDDAFFAELKTRIRVNDNIEDDSVIWGEVFIINSRDEIVNFIEFGYDFILK